TFAFIMYLRPGKLSRRKVVTWIAQTVIFLVAWYIAAIPFKAYFATAYTSAQPFINQKTPLCAYLDIHGLFLFIIISVLVWQSARLLTRIYVRDFIGRRWAFLLVFLSISFTVALTFLMSLLPLQTSFLVLPVPISVVCLPLLAWCVILF